MHRSLLILPLLTLALMPGCDSSVAPPVVPPAWQTINVGRAFTFRAPPDVQTVPVQGIDSLVGQYTSDTLEIGYDYGMYSDTMDRDGFASRSVTVDGKSARLVTRADLVGIHFPSVGDKTRLTITVRGKGGDPKIAETILQSIDFP
jgi:hypothetical protein